jgi:hypothetical protein
MRLKKHIWVRNQEIFFRNQVSKSKVRFRFDFGKTVVGDRPTRWKRSCRVGSAWFSPQLWAPFKSSDQLDFPANFAHHLNRRISSLYPYISLSLYFWIATNVIADEKKFFSLEEKKYYFILKLKNGGIKMYHLFLFQSPAKFRQLT